MSTYILLTNLSATSLGSPRNREQVGRKWFETVKKKCPEVKWIDHYALHKEFLDVVKGL